MVKSAKRQPGHLDTAGAPTQLYGVIRDFYTTQQEVLLAAIGRKESMFLTGSAGTGKSHVIHELSKRLNGVAVTASTGIAARNIGGQTVHRWSGMGAPRALDDPNLDHQTAVRQVMQETVAKRFFDRRQEEICETKCLIIDEVSMLSGPFLDALDVICRHARAAVDRTAQQKSFGGLQVILVGDPFQLPPVARGRKAIPCFEAAIFSDPNFKKANLQQIFRQSDPVFVAALNQIRLGRVTEPIDKLFKERETAKASRELRPVYLFPTNDGADKYNQLLLGEEKGDLKVMKMHGEGEEEHQKNLRKLILPPETLNLKVNARVMSTKNDPEGLYCNGSLGRVKEIRSGAIVVQFDENKEPATIERHTWDTLTDKERDERERIEEAKGYWEKPHGYAEVSQFPLILGYAMTIHKSQGLTFDRAFINLTQSFEAGQAYVALSRVKSLDGLYLRGWNPDKIWAPKDTLAYMEKMFGSGTHAEAEAKPAIPHVTPLPAAVAPTPVPPVSPSVVR